MFYRCCDLRSFLLLYFISILLFAGCAHKIVKKVSEPEIYTGVLEEVKNAKIDIGDEHFEKGKFYRYRIDWLGMPVGFVTFTMDGKDVIKDRDVYVVSLRAQTNKFASKVYRIEDVYTSYIDDEKIIPLRYDVDRKEGNYRKRATTYFDHDNGIAYFENFLDKSKKTYEIPNGVLDPISAIIKAQKLNMALGKYYVMDVANNEEIYKIHACVEKRENLNVENMGNFEAYYIAPYAVLKGERVKKGTVSGYISTGQNKFLLCAEVKAPLFTKLRATVIEIDKLR